MYLRKLRLANIRCFEEIELDFSMESGNGRPWTVLLGENGTGKSTILRAIGLLLAGFDALPHLLDLSLPWVRRGATRGLLHATIETAESGLRDLELVFEPGDSLLAISQRARVTLDLLDAALKHSTRNYLVVGYGATRRLGRPGLSATMDPSRPLRARALATLFDSAAELVPLDTWAMSLDYKGGDLGLETVARTLNDFLPDVHFERIDRKREELIFATPDGLVPLRGLSEGYQNVAAWVGDLLHHVTQAYRDFNDPLLARGVLLLDEMDLHLHPTWQRRLIEFLGAKLPNFQIVATTHSVVTAQQAPEGALHYLEREGAAGPVRLHRFDADPGLLRVNQLLTTDAFGVTSDESLDVERDKQRYRELAAMPARSMEMDAEMSRIADRIGERPLGSDEAPFLTAAQRKLMVEIEARFRSGA